MTTRDKQNDPGGLAAVGDPTVAYRHTVAGADYVPRCYSPPFKSGSLGEIHWFYEPTLLRGVAEAKIMCTAGPNRPAVAVPNIHVTEHLEGGVPCPNCNARWPLPTRRAEL